MSMNTNPKITGFGNFWVFDENNENQKLMRHFSNLSREKQTELLVEVFGENLTHSDTAVTAIINQEEFEKNFKERAKKEHVRPSLGVNGFEELFVRLAIHEFMAPEMENVPEIE